MSTTNNQSSLSNAGVKRTNFSSSSAALWSAILALVLAAPAQAASDEPPATEKDRTIVAVFRLDGPITETSAEETFQLFGLPGTSLKDLVSRLGKAADDPAVKAVVILPESMPSGPAQVEELRAALSLVRSHGKEVYVHADSLVMGQYGLACGASRISLVPTGPVIIPGLQGSSLHVRGLLDKIGVKPDFVTEGAYKSAAELFMREQPSPEADEMMNWLLDSRYASFMEQIAKGRKTDAAKVQGWLDQGLFTADQAKAAGLIDAVEHRQDFEAMLKERYGSDVIFAKKYGRKNEPDLDFSSPFSLVKIWMELFRGPEKKADARPVVGIVYVNGPIMDGKGMASPFGGSLGAFSSDVQRALEKAAADNSIKAVVLRINSPGGSATASEVR